MNKFLKASKLFASKHSTKILCGLAVIAEIGAVIFAAKEAPVAEKRLKKLPKNAKKIDKIKAVAPVYLPAAGMLAMAVGCTVGGTVIGLKQLASVTSLYTASSKALTEYQKKVVEKLGEEKAQEIQDAVAQELINEKPPAVKDIYATGKGDEIFYEPLTSRYFTSSRHEVEEAEIRLNHTILREMEASVNEWFYELGLEPAGLAADKVWDVDHKLELSFSLAWTPDGRSCTMIGYPVLPVIHK